jgi:hypothetical protein
MVNSKLSFKEMLQKANEFEQILENALNDSEHREKVEEMLKQVRAVKQWIIDNYPPGQYLLDNPYIDN